MGRYIAKNLVSAGACDRALVQLSYAIGVAEPVSVMVDTFGTSKVSESRITRCARDIFPLKPKGIIERLDLRKPVYQKTAAYGHFGRPDFTWENTDVANTIKRYLEI